MTFAALGIIAAIAIALGAYWHIYTLGMCAVMVYAIRREERPKMAIGRYHPGESIL
jgi:hypothetical protein